MFENYKVFETDFAGRPLKIETGKIAVSYTHLDVYKRQALGTSTRTPISTALLMVCRLFARAMEVSHSAPPRPGAATI